VVSRQFCFKNLKTEQAWKAEHLEIHRRGRMASSEVSSVSVVVVWIYKVGAIKIPFPSFPEQNARNWEKLMQWSFPKSLSNSSIHKMYVDVRTNEKKLWLGQL
jgi:hypothetical protein